MTFPLSRIYHFSGEPINLSSPYFPFLGVIQTALALSHEMKWNLAQRADGEENEEENGEENGEENEEENEEENVLQCTHIRNAILNHLHL